MRAALPVSESEGVYGKDPKFVDAEGGKLELAPGSPARTAGPRAASKPESR